MKPRLAVTPPTALRTRLVPAAIVSLTLGLAAAASAQSVLGTIRGTLVDSRDEPVARAAIRAVDENTGVLRSVETDLRGNYEIPNLRAGAYRVEDNSPGFVAFGRGGIVLRAGETVRVDLRLITAAAAEVAVAAPEPAAPAPKAPAPTAPPAAAPAKPAAPPSTAPGIPAAPMRRIQPGTEVVVTAEGGSAIQLESPSIQTGLDAQQLSMLPRGSRDFQDFLFLDANVTGHYDTLQALGGRSYGFTYLQDGQPSNGVLFGIVTNGSPGLEAIDEVKVLSNAYSAEFGGLGAFVVTSRRGGNRVSGSAFYDGNRDELNALLYPQKQAGLERGYPGSNTEDHRFGASLSGPIAKEKTFFFLNYEGRLSRQTHREPARGGPDRGDAGRGLLGGELRHPRPADRAAVPGQRDSRGPHQPPGRERAGLLLPAAEPAAARERPGPLPGLPEPEVHAPPGRPAHRPRVLPQRLRLRARQLPAARSRQHASRMRASRNWA